MTGLVSGGAGLLSFTRVELVPPIFPCVFGNRLFRPSDVGLNFESHTEINQFPYLGNLFRRP